LEFPTTRKRSPENGQDAMPKDPTNIVNKNAIVGRGENVFLALDNNPILTYI
jgi:hypothetical protein